MWRIVFSVFVIGSLAGVATFYENSAMQAALYEVQSAADGAALAGAGIFAIDPNAVDAASVEARNYAALNFVRGERVELAPEDIEAIPDEGIVRVTVRVSMHPANLAQRVLWLAIGVRGSTITASAAAEARAPDPSRPDRAPKRLKLIE